MVFGSLSVQDDRAIPVFAPPYVSQEPFHFSNMTIVSISYRVQASQIQHLVPQELELEDQPIMTSLFIHYGTSTVGEYNEYVHTVRVKFNKGFASPPWANLDVVSYIGSWMGKSKAVLGNKVDRFPL
ncbi:acetoacetate decarboxylase [Fusarium globosum]|uniref:Acetoacetate decarboxylase n=1 Tax=Fusarium globosum TaxID=78864 RepID=A0A8H5XUW3_9HYPO|nr:acetoacetate decarboxylase [Fusarium globosum]